MDLEIKKDLVSNWFKNLQNAICNSIKEFEKNKIMFETTNWKKSKKRDEGEMNIEYLKMEKFSIKLE